MIEGDFGPAYFFRGPSQSTIFLSNKQWAKYSGSNRPPVLSNFSRVTREERNKSVAREKMAFENLKIIQKLVNRIQASWKKNEPKIALKISY